MKALLLLGSPRKKSTSRVLGRTLLSGLAARGWETGELRLHGLLDVQEGRARLLGETASADLIVLAAPVYVDALPAPVMHALEFLAGEPGQAGKGEGAGDAGRAAGGKPRRLAAIFNCGFPEASHNDISLSACRLFARDAGLGWAGGLGVGGGGAVGGRPLAERGRLFARLTRALDMAAEALAAGRDIPDEAVRLAASPAVPGFLYILMAEAGWIASAWRSKSLSRLGARPYFPR